MTIIGTTTGISAWLTASISLARNTSVPLEKIQARVDSMTDALSESGHRLAWDVSYAALQIGMYAVTTNDGLKSAADGPS